MCTASFSCQGKLKHDSWSLQLLEKERQFQKRNDFCCRFSLSKAAVKMAIVLFELLCEGSVYTRHHSPALQHSSKHLMRCLN